MTIVGWLDHCSATGVPLCLRLRARPPHRHQRPCLLMPPCHLAAAAATSLVSFILRLTAPLWSRRQWQKTFYLNIKRKNETFATTISEKVPVLGSVACESLDSREFSRLFLLKFHFYFTFTSRSWFPVISISLSFLEKSERETNFTLFLEKKEWNLTPNFIKKINHLWRVRNPKQSMSGMIF